MQSYNTVRSAGDDDDGLFASLQDQAVNGHDRALDSVPDESQLRADLSRSLRVVARNPTVHQPTLQDSSSLLSLNLDDTDTIHTGPIDGQQTDAAHKARQKTSKACDECRRKKIRCNTTDDPSAGPCSHCKRTGVVCAFSRQQMKRGPSKGYIKDLADRLNSFESHTPPQTDQHASGSGFAAVSRDTLNTLHHMPPDNQRSSQRHAQSHTSPPAAPPQLAGTKRAHSSYDISQAIGPSQPDPNASSYDGMYMFQDLMFSSQIDPALTSPLGDPMPQDRFNSVSASQPFFRQGDHFGQMQNLSMPYDSGPTAVTSLKDWDDEVIDEYYRLIHKTFPILPHSKIRLRARLSDCPVGLREACLIALACLMRTFPAFDSTLKPTSDYSSSIKRAAELLASYPFESPSMHTSTSNLVYLQTLILMALESDNHGPATVRGQAGPSRAEWLGRAAGVAGQSEIHLCRPRERFSSEGDPDSDERIARRIWWSLFILDRWHASSTADLLKLPENSGVLLPEDQILLGESTYHLARLSFIIGHLSAILTTTRTPSTNVMAASNPASQLLGLTLAGEIDRFRESVESVWGSLNLVHLSYHHSHLLIKRLSPTTEPSEMLDHAVKVATVLNQRQTPITPLNHHFAALSAMTLCELVDLPRTSVEARKGLAHLAEALGLGRGLAGHPSDSTGWDSAIRTLVMGKLAKLDSGQHVLAEDGRSFDPTELTKYGYLTALGQGRFVT